MHFNERWVQRTVIRLQRAARCTRPSESPSPSSARRPARRVRRAARDECVPSSKACAICHDDDDDFQFLALPSPNFSPYTHSLNNGLFRTHLHLPSSRSPKRADHHATLCHWWIRSIRPHRKHKGELSAIQNRPKAQSSTGYWNCPLFWNWVRFAILLCLVPATVSFTPSQKKQMPPLTG